MSKLPPVLEIANMDMGILLVFGSGMFFVMARRFAARSYYEKHGKLSIERDGNIKAAKDPGTIGV